MDKKMVIGAAVVVAGLMALDACMPRREENPLPGEQPSRVVAILRDESGSFAAEKKVSSELTLNVLERLIRNNNADRVVIAQLSGNSTPLVFEGSVLDLRARFPDPESFARHLSASADPKASRIHAGLCDTLDYVESMPAVTSGKASMVTVLLSDMEDSQSPDPESDPRLMRTLMRYGAKGGSMVIYWCEQSRVATWRGVLSKMKIKGDVYGKIVANPPIPQF